VHLVTLLLCWQRADAEALDEELLPGGLGLPDDARVLSRWSEVGREKEAERFPERTADTVLALRRPATRTDCLEHMRC
jgi:hypothetical protein